MSESAEITHGETLWETLDVLRDSGQHGAKVCLGMAKFLSERAAIETSYGNALIRAAKQAGKGWGQTTAKRPVWAPSLVQEGWAGTVSAVNSWGKQHVGWARCIDHNIAKTLTEFSQKHKGHVSRLWAEAQDLVSDLEVVSGQYYKARERYEQSCIQASRLLDERNKARQVAAAQEAAAAEAAAAAAQTEASGGDRTVQSITPTKEKEAAASGMLLSVSKMLGEGMAMAEKMLEKAAGELSLVELEEKVPEQLRMVDVTETEYIASIMALNGYNTEFQPEMEKKLKEFSLLEECRITFIKEVLLRLDQASKGMLACLLGPGGTLEALSLALSRIDALKDASSQLLFVRNCAGMQPLPTTRGALDAPLSSGVGKEESVQAGIARVVSVPEEQLMAITQGREATGAEVLELPEDGCENVFFAGRDGANEAVRVLQEVCCCLGEVVSAEENHTRELLRLLQRHGYGSRVSQSKNTGGRGSIGMMEDVMANMSKPSSSACAGAIAGEGQTLTQGWDCSAVGKALAAVEAHTGLAHALADGPCATAIQAHNEAKASVKRAAKTFSAASKQLVNSRNAHAKAVSRCDKLTREVHEKEESLAKARLDLAAELQASGGASIVPVGAQTPPSGAAASAASLSVFESLGLGQQAGSRVKALEVKVATLVEERDAAKQNVRDAIHAMKAALEELRLKVKDTLATLFAEDSSRHTGLAELLQVALSSFLETAKELAKGQQRADEAKTTERIDGRKDVQELVDRNAARVRQRGAVGEVMFMAYHSEVLQKERDMLRRNRLTSPRSAQVEKLQEEKGDSSGARRAGGGSHRFSVMAEAALAQAQAKQQKRQILARQEEAKVGGRERGTSDAGGPTPALSSSVSLTDGEGTNFPRRDRRRHWQGGRAAEASGGCLSDSEVVMCDNSSASRHGGSLHGMVRRGSRHGSSRHGSSRHAKSYHRHGSSISLRHRPHPRQDWPGRVQGKDKFDRDVAAKQNVAMSISSAVEGTAAERVTSVANDPATPVVQRSGAAAVVVNDAEAITPASGSELDGEQGEHAEILGESMSAGLTGRSAGDGGKPAPETSLDGTKSPSAVKSEGAGREVTWESPRGLEKHSSLVRPLATPAGGVVTAVEGQTLTELPREANPATDVGADSSSESALAAEAERSENNILPPTNQAGASEAAAIGHEQVTSSVPVGVGENVAPTEEGMPAIGEEEEAPTEESAPTEERGRAGSPIGFSSLELLTEQQIAVGGERSSRFKGRPSLRHLENRLRDQDDFSSGGEEADEMSSSDDDQVPESAGGFDLSPSDRKPASTPTRGEQNRASEEDFNVLDSFDLPEEALQDKVIESYSCGLGNVHGRLYVTSKYALFSGWRNTKVVLRLSDVVGVEKTSTLRIVPNALTLIKRDGEKVTLGSFLFRDDCHSLLLRLVTVSSSISKIHGASPAAAIGAISGASLEGIFVASDEQPAGDAPPEPSESAPGTAISGALAVASRPCGNFETMVEAVLPCTTAQVFAWVWGRRTTFWEEFLRAQGETGLEITHWRNTAVSADAGRRLGDLFPGETFDEQRELTFTHPRTGFVVVGPKKVFTRQQQGFRVERRESSSGARTAQGDSPMDRVVVCQTTMLERGAPMADTFTVLGRVVLTREPGQGPDREPRCRVHIGFDVAFHKSTMLRGAIRAGAQEETRNSWNSWLHATKKVVMYQRHQLGREAANDGVAAPPPAKVFALARDFKAGGVATSAAGQLPRGVESEIAAKPLDGNIDWFKLVVGTVRWLLENGVAAVKLAGVPTVLTLFCVLLVARQQREVQRLTSQLEELLEDLRNKIDE